MPYMRTAVTRSPVSTHTTESTSAVTGDTGDTALIKLGARSSEKFKRLKVGLAIKAAQRTAIDIS